MSDAYIRNFVDTTMWLDPIVHGFFVDGQMHGAAELRPIGGRFSKQAEAAFSVENEWQSHGVGSALLERTILTARNRGIAHLHMACLADNRRMQQLARKFDAERSFDFGEWSPRWLSNLIAVDGARDGLRRPEFRNRDPRRAIPAAESNLTLTSRYLFAAQAVSLSGERAQDDR